MGTRVRVPLIFLIWVIIGVLVAVNNGYDQWDRADEVGTFILAVVLWPVIALGGEVRMVF